MKIAKNTKKLLAAASALVVAVAVSAGTTFAWFTTNSTVTVSNISATVKADGGENLMIAVGHGTSDVSFKTSLDKDDLNSYLSNITLDAVTYVGDETENKMRTASIDNGELSYSAAGTSAYVRIPLTIRTDSVTAVYLHNDSSKSSSTVTGSETVSSSVTASDAWTDTTAGYYNGGSNAITGTISAYAKNATRVGVTTASGTLSNKEYGTEGAMKVWSPNEALFTGGEYTSGTANRDFSSDTTNYYKHNLAGDYYEYINGLESTTITQKTYSNYLVTDYEGSNASLDKSTYTIATTAQLANAGENDPAYAYIYVYIWIEGTDGDCFNNILGQSITVNLSLTVPTTT